MFTKEELELLLEVVNMSGFKGEHVEMVAEIKKKIKEALNGN